jgi:hypothetical protein
LNLAIFPNDAEFALCAFSNLKGETMRSPLPLLVGSLFLAVSANAQQTEMSDQDLMADLNGAAPRAIVENATIMKMSADGKLSIIREGTNGWT